MNEFRCYEVKVKRWAFAATEPRQPDNHQPSQSSPQVVLNASIAHLAATQYVLSEVR